MIFVDGRPLLTNSNSHSPQDGGDALLSPLLEHPYLVSASDRLKSIPAKNASEWLALGGPSPRKHVYVFQREYATVDPALVQFAGTDEATTCVGVVIRNRENGMTSVAHLDSPKVVDSGLAQMLTLVLNHGTHASIDVHLIGAFDDAHYEYVNSTSRLQDHSNQLGYSRELCSKIIAALQSRRENFHIQTSCILGHNTKRDSKGNPFPIIRGFLVETSSASIVPADFDMNSRSPDEIIRRVRVMVSSDDPSCRGKLLDTYDTKHDMFQIGPCIWRLDWSFIANSLNQLSDEEILLQCSTSPSAEDTDFVANMRRVIDYLTSYPDWRHTFSRRKARVFERTSDGGWLRCK